MLDCPKENHRTTKTPTACHTYIEQPELRSYVPELITGNLTPNQTAALDSAEQPGGRLLHPIDQEPVIASPVIPNKSKCVVYVALSFLTTLQVGWIKDPGTL